MKPKKNGKKIASTFKYALIIFLISLNIYYGLKNRHLEGTLKKNGDNYFKSFLREMELYSNFGKTEVPQDIFIASNIDCSYLLVYFYAGGECEKCIIGDIEKIRELLLPEYSDKVLIFPVFNYKREIEIQIDAVLQGVNYMRLDRNKIILPEINHNPARFFAILTPDGNIINRYFPDLLLPEKTEMYLQYVKEKFLKPD